MPVPVPISKIFAGLGDGGLKWSLSPMVSLTHRVAGVEPYLVRSRRLGHDVASALESVTASTVLDWVPLDAAG